MTTTATQQPKPTQSRAGAKRLGTRGPAPGAGGRPKAGTAVAVHRPQQPKSFLEVIKDAALDPRVDVQKMQALLDMQMQVEARQAEIAFNNALAEAAKKIPVIAKNAKGDRGITYATLEKVSRTIDPILKEYGFTIQFSMADSPNVDSYRIVATLSRGGHKREYFADIPVSITGPKGAPIMTKTQGAGSAISFGRRYLKLMIFDITITGEDNDGGAGNPPDLITEAQVKDLRAKMKQAELDDETFCSAFKIGAVEQLPASKLETALTRIKTRIENMG